MPWVCSIGVCQTPDIECEECEHYKEDDEEFKYDDYDHCYECRGLGDDYIYNDDGELESYCDRCGYNPDNTLLSR